MSKRTRPIYSWPWEDPEARHLTWKAIPGFPDYFVSSSGSVWSRGRPRSKGGILRGKRKSEPNPNKYPMVMLSQDGKVTPFLVHHLVAFVFLGPRPDGYHVDHKDGNRHNNAVSNLRYLTPGDNNREAGKRNGYKGQIEGSRKLSDDDVRQIRSLYQQGTRQHDLSLMFNIAQSSISKIINRRQWSNVE